MEEMVYDLLFGEGRHRGNGRTREQSHRSGALCFVSDLPLKIDHRAVWFGWFHRSMDRSIHIY